MKTYIINYVSIRYHQLSNNHWNKSNLKIYTVSYSTVSQTQCIVIPLYHTAAVTWAQQLKKPQLHYLTLIAMKPFCAPDTCVCQGPLDLDPLLILHKRVTKCYNSLFIKQDLNSNSINRITMFYWQRICTQKRKQGQQIICLFILNRYYTIQ